MFYQWLIAQRDRTDDIGRFSRRALSNKLPKNIESLHALLRVVDTSSRDRLLMKKAHREFRYTRRILRQRAA